MLSLPLLLLFLAALALTPLHAVAKHSTCTWKIGPGSPAKYKFTRWCQADGAISTTGYGDYYCSRDYGWRHGIRVADFNELGPSKLEFATPCGGHGFAAGRNDNFDCVNYPWWAICLGPADAKQVQNSVECRYMYAMDDCEWPFTFSPDTLPRHLDIWAFEDFDWEPWNGPPCPPLGCPAGGGDVQNASFASWDAADGMGSLE